MNHKSCLSNSVSLTLSSCNTVEGESDNDDTFNGHLTNKVSVSVTKLVYNLLYYGFDRYSCWDHGDGMTRDTYSLLRLSNLSSSSTYEISTLFKNPVYSYVHCVGYYRYSTLSR